MQGLFVRAKSKSVPTLTTNPAGPANHPNTLNPVKAASAPKTGRMNLTANRFKYKATFPR